MSIIRTIVDGNVHKEITEEVLTPIDYVMRDVAISIKDSKQRIADALTAYNNVVSTETDIQNDLVDEWIWGRDNGADMPTDFDSDANPI